MYEITMNDKHKEIFKLALNAIKTIASDNYLDFYKELFARHNKRLIESSKGKNARFLKANGNVQNVLKIDDLLECVDKGVFTIEECKNLAFCLDIYSRLGIGQVDIFYQELNSIGGNRHSAPITSFCDLSSIYRHDVLGLPHGIYHSFLSIADPNVLEEFRVAYEAYKVIKRHLSYEKNPEGGWTVNFDMPLKVSDVEFIKIKKC